MKATRAEINERVRLIRDGNPPRLPHNRSEEVFWHPAFPSFGVRQTYTGQASWIVQYKLHGRSRKVTVGDVRLLDEMEARKAAKKILAKVELDRLDPQAAKEEARRSAKVTFESVTEQFLAERQDSSRPSTQRVRKLYLGGYYFSSLHGLPIDEITHEQITLRLQQIKQTSGSVTASHCLDNLSVMFKWAIRKGHHPGPNPMLRIDRPAESPSRARVLNDEEIRTVWLACEVWEALIASGHRVGGTIPDFSYAIRLLFLTGCRAGEIGDLEWDEIDFRENELAIPGSRTKNKEPLYLPLVDTALKILARVKRRPGEKHVFGQMPGKGLGVGNQARQQLDKRIVRAGGVPPPKWTLHDIRRTVRSYMGAIGINPDIAERVVNHIGHRNEMARTYDRHTYRPQMRDALERWERRLLNIVRGTDEEVAAQVFAQVTEAQRAKRSHRHLSVKRSSILAALKEAGAAMSPPDIAAATRMPNHNVYRLLSKMAKRGEVIKTERGRYAASTKEVTP
jgi:integrase